MTFNEQLNTFETVEQFIRVYDGMSGINQIKWAWDAIGIDIYDFEDMTKEERVKVLHDKLFGFHYERRPDKAFFEKIYKLAKEDLAKDMLF